MGGVWDLSVVCSVCELHTCISLVCANEIHMNNYIHINLLSNGRRVGSESGM